MKKVFNISFLCIFLVFISWSISFSEDKKDESKLKPYSQMNLIGPDMFSGTGEEMKKLSEG